MTKLVLVGLAAGALWGLAALYQDWTWHQTAGTVERRLRSLELEISYEDAAGTERTEVVRVDAGREGGQPEVGDSVPLRVDRSDPSEVVIAAPPSLGVDGGPLLLAVLAWIVVVILTIAPEFIRVNEPSQVREDHGFYWRS